LVHESGYLIEEDPKQYSIINKSKIEPFTEMVQFYRSHNWRYAFYKGKLTEGPFKKGEADLNGFVPIPNSIPKKRKKPTLVNPKSSIKEDRKEAGTLPNNIIANGNKKMLLFQLKKMETPDKQQTSVAMTVTVKRILKP
jgi:hypothetical protein